MNENKRVAQESKLHFSKTTIIDPLRSTLVQSKAHEQGSNALASDNKYKDSHFKDDWLSLSEGFFEQLPSINSKNEIHSFPTVPDSFTPKLPSVAFSSRQIKTFDRGLWHEGEGKRHGFCAKKEGSAAVNSDPAPLQWRSAKESEQEADDAVTVSSSYPISSSRNWSQVNKEPLLLQQQDVGTTYLSRSPHSVITKRDGIRKKLKIPPSKLFKNQTFSTAKSNTNNATSSSFSTLTQNLLGHAKDLQNLARNAAASFLTTAANTRDTLLEETFLDLRLWEDNPFLLDGWDSQETSLQKTFDPKYPYFGCFKIGWTLLPFRNQNNFCLPRISKCNCCRSVCIVSKSSALPQLSYSIILPETMCQHAFLLSSHNNNLPQTSSSEPLLNASEKKVVHPPKEQLGASSGLYIAEVLLSSLPNVTVLSTGFPALTGRLICTTFRLYFEPDITRSSVEVTLGTQWAHLCNYWDIPLACLESVHQGSLTSKERLFLLNNSFSPHATSLQKKKYNKIDGGGGGGGFAISIAAKDGRKFRIVYHDDCGREVQTISVIRAASIQSNLTDLFAFKIADTTTTASCRRRQGDKVSLSSDDIWYHLCKSKIYSNDGWLLYDPEREWTRMITNYANNNSRRINLRLSTINVDFHICRTYPQLFVVPYAITDDMIEKIAGYRSKQRLPILSWASSYNNSTLWRCSQPKAMFYRCIEDEEFLMEISKSSATTDDKKIPLIIVDARPLVNAMINKASGAGFEDTSTYYTQSRIEFANIENIHHVRAAYKQMVLAVSNIQIQTIHLTSSFSLLHRLKKPLPLLMNSDDTTFNCPLKCEVQQNSRVLNVEATAPMWVYGTAGSALGSNNITSFSSSLQQISTSNWYDHIQSILRASNLIISRLSLGQSVVVHCSDGWDRTAQLTSLAMICLDPHYRTIKGFLILIEQEFLHGGHQFHLRCGHPGTFESSHNNNNIEDEVVDLDEEGPGEVSETSEKKQHNKIITSRRQRSPIFLQWLESVYQILTQFPHAFEFTASLLNVLAIEVYSCFFGTFLLDCQMEREMSKLNEKTLSLWSSIALSISLYINPEYMPIDSNVSPLFPSPYSITIWYSYWFRYHPLGLDFLIKDSINHESTEA